MKNKLTTILLITLLPLAVLGGVLVFLNTGGYTPEKAPGHEIERLGKLPWITFADTGNDYELTLIDFKGDSAIMRDYYYLDEEKDLKALGEQYETPLLRKDQVDLNGDKYEDFVLVTRLEKSSDAPEDAENTRRLLAFYVGCGGGWFYNVLSVESDDNVPGLGYTLHDSVEENGVAWKTVNAPSRYKQKLQKRAFYHFRDSAYTRMEAERLQNIPWVNNRATFVDFYDIKSPEPSSCYWLLSVMRGKNKRANLRQNFRAFDHTRGLSGLEAKTETTDLNGDDLPDLILRHEKDGVALMTSFFAGCGDDWYMLVFQTTAPDYRLGTPDNADESGKSWKTIMIPPAWGIPPEGFNVYAVEQRTVFSPASGQVAQTKKSVSEGAWERYRFGGNGYVPVSGNSEFVASFRKHWGDRVQELYRPTPYGMEEYVISRKGSVTGYEKKENPEELFFKAFHPWHEGEYPLMPVEFNDDEHSDFIFKEFAGYNQRKDRQFVSRGLAGCSNGFFVRVLTSRSKVRLDWETLTKSRGVTWYKLETSSFEEYSFDEDLQQYMLE